MVKTAARRSLCFTYRHFDRCPLLAQSRHELLHRTCPLLGVKRTWLFAPRMSASDPKRTLVPHIPPPPVFSRYDALSLSLGGEHEATRLHHAFSAVRQHIGRSAHMRNNWIACG